jgi:hypothetical protein
MLARPLLYASLLTVFTGTAVAQQSVAVQPATQAASAPASPAVAEQQRLLAAQNQQMAKAALQVAGLIDQGKAGEVWDGASEVAKKLVSRRDFVSQVTADRRTVGTLISRTVARISRAQSSGGATPAGVYISVAFASQFANAKQPVRELVSFHFDHDRTWRVSGYTLR